jgi:hypothetical protein
MKGRCVEALITYTQLSTIFLWIGHTKKESIRNYYPYSNHNLGPIRDIQKDRDNFHNLLAINFNIKWVHQNHPFKLNPKDPINHSSTIKLNETSKNNK